MTWKREAPCGNESGKVVWETTPYVRGRGLDLGCGPNKVWPHAIGVDNYTETQLFGIQMKPDVVCDVTKLEPFATGSMDFVYSSHVLEHMVDPLATLKQWWRVLKVGGYLILYLPHDELYPKVGEEGANPDHRHDLNEQKVIDWMKQVGSWDLVRSETRDQEQEYSFFQVYLKL